MGQLNIAALVLSVGALVAMLRFKVGMLWTLVGAAVLGATWSFFPRRLFEASLQAVNEKKSLQPAYEKHEVAISAD